MNLSLYSHIMFAPCCGPRSLTKFHIDYGRWNNGDTVEPIYPPFLAGGCPKHHFEFLFLSLWIIGHCKTQFDFILFRFMLVTQIVDARDTLMNAVMRTLRVVRTTFPVWFDSRARYTTHLMKALANIENTEKEPR